MAKYKSVLITVDHLKKLDACKSGIEWFISEFPNGIKISNSQDEMNELIASIDFTGLYGKYYSTISFLQFFVEKTCCDEDGPYPLYPFSWIRGIFEDEFHTHECGAFLSDCRLLND